MKHELYDMLRERSKIRGASFPLAIIASIGIHMLILIFFYFSVKSETKNIQSHKQDDNLKSALSSDSLKSDNMDTYKNDENDVSLIKEPGPINSDGEYQNHEFIKNIQRMKHATSEQIGNDDSARNAIHGLNRDNHKNESKSRQKKRIF